MSNEERYRERVKDAFENFLVSPFIEYNPYSVNDEHIIADAKERSIIKYDGGLLQRMQSFAAIYTIDGAVDMEYNDNKFKQLILKASDGKLLRVNFSDFQYYTSFFNGINNFSEFGYEYDDSNARYINLLDDKQTPPESIASKAGTHILLGYHFNTVNRYRNQRTCHRLYSLTNDNELDAALIRKQILRAQAFSLLVAAKYPVLCLPTSNRETIYPYMHNITIEIGVLYTSKLLSKLHEVEQALREHGLAYEKSI